MRSPHSLHAPYGGATYATESTLWGEIEQGQGGRSLEGGCTGMVRGTQLALVTICYNPVLACLQLAPHNYHRQQGAAHRSTKTTTTRKDAHNTEGKK